jgi:DNA-binding NtrC family response regulator
VGTDERKRVLVVDDDAGVRSLIGKIVALEDAVPTIAGSGEEALDLLEREFFDLLVTENNLPGVNGLELAQVARAMRPGMTVLLVTGYSSVESARQAAAQGVIDYIIKPVIVDELRSSLRRGLAASVRSVFPAGSRSDEAKGPAAAGTGVAQRIVPGLRDELTRPLERLARPPEWVSQPSAEALRLSVLVVEPDEAHRTALTTVFSSLGHEVVSFPSADRAETQVAHAGFDVLVAGPEILLTRPHWLRGAGGRRPLGALAIMDGLGVDKVIAAIHVGARGLVAPPFDEDQVRRDLEIAVSHMREDAEIGSG